MGAQVRLLLKVWYVTMGGRASGLSSHVEFFSDSLFPQTVVCRANSAYWLTRRSLDTAFLDTDAFGHQTQVDSGESAQRPSVGLREDEGWVEKSASEEASMHRANEEMAAGRHKTQGSDHDPSQWFRPSHWPSDQEFVNSGSTQQLGSLPSVSQEEGTARAVQSGPAPGASGQLLDPASTLAGMARDLSSDSMDAVGSLVGIAAARGLLGKTTMPLIMAIELQHKIDAEIDKLYWEFF